MVERSARVVTTLLAVLTLSAGVAAADWNAAVSAYRAHEWKIAAQELGAVVAKNPTYAPAYYLLGLTRLKLEDAQAAVTAFRRAAELEPGNTEFSVGLVMGLVAAGRPDAALDVASTVSTDELPAEQQRTLALQSAQAGLDLHDPLRGLPTVRKALLTSPDSPSLHRALGNLLEAAGDLEGAFASYGRAVRLDPAGEAGAGRRALYVARLLARRAGDDAARSRWRGDGLALARELAGDDAGPDTLRLAGLVALEAGESTMAARCLQAAVEARPEDEGLAYDLGRALTAAGAEDRAYAVFAAILERQPDPELARRAHRQLARIAAHRGNLDTAAEQFRAAGDGDRADELAATARGLAEAQARSDHLHSKLRELESARKELQKLGDGDGVAAMDRQIDLHRKTLDAVEKNLADVKAALRNL